MHRNTHSPPSTSSSPSEIRLLTLNCWGLKYLSADRASRLSEIGRHLAAIQPAPHIVCLQECWTQDDYRNVRRQTRSVLPYGKFYFGGAFGAGLVVLSAWPIEESTMVSYPLNGRPTAFFRGDWYVGKGVACAKIRFGPGRRDIIEVFNTHTHAPYEKEPKDSYICHRTAQAWHMSKLLRGASSRGHLVAALGDFNMLPCSLAHRIITCSAPVRDAWQLLHPHSAVGPAHHPEQARRGHPVPGAAFNVGENGATSDSVLNTWRWDKARQKALRRGEECVVEEDTPDPKGKRLDYIFASTGDVETSDDGSGWVVKDVSVAMTERHPTLHCSLSDHFAVRATLTRHTPRAESLRSPRPKSIESSAIKSGAFLAADSPPSSSRGAKDFPSHDPAFFDNQLLASLHQPSLPLEVYDEILAMITWYTSRERSQRRWRGLHFYGSLVVWVACLIAVWFSPGNYVSFILMLVASLGLVTGVVNGLLALLFFSAEIRSLAEFEWEVRNAKAGATGDLVAPFDEEFKEEKA